MSKFQPKQYHDTNISVLIPDGESHLLVYTINCLSSIKGIRIYVMSSIRWNAHKFSRHVNGFTYYPKTEDDQQWLNYITKEVEKNHIDVVMPIFETGIRRVIQNRHLLNSNVKLVPLPDLSTFSLAINKWKLVGHCQSNNIPVPDSFLLKPGQQIEDVIPSDIIFPLLVKPLEGFGGGMGVVVFNAKKELHAYAKKIQYSILIQQYIKGYDIDCSVLVKDGKITAHTIQQGNLKGATPFVPHVGLEFKENPKLLKVVESLMGSLKWNGIAHLDMRYDQERNGYVVIEINPRCWATMDGSCLMGVNFPYLSILQTKNITFDIETYRKENYLNLKGIIKSIKKNVFFLFKWKFIFNNTQFRFVLLDPAPTVYKFMDRTKNIILKRMKGR